MKSSSIVRLCVGLAAATAAHAQVIISGGQGASLEVEMSAVPKFGIFWSAAGKFPPSPFDPFPELPLYEYGPASGYQYVYDDLNFDYDSWWKQNNQLAAQNAVSEAQKTPVIKKQLRVKKSSANHPMFEFLNGVSELSLKVLSTNATLTWPSSPGNLYLIESAPDLLSGSVSGGGIPWMILTNALPAATGVETSFTDFNPVIYPTNTGGTGGGGGGGGVPMPGSGGTNSGSGMPDGSTTRFYVVYNVTPITGQPVFAVSENSSANQLNIFQNAFDPNDGFLYVASLTQPQNGSISYTANGSTFQYTPNSGFFGIDSFPFMITNSYGGSASGVASVFVTESSDAGLSANSLILTLATNQYTTNFNAISNSSSPSSILFSVSTPQFGTITTNASGNVTYTRNASQFGTDSFTYIVTDGSGACANGIVQIQQVSTMDNGLPDQWQLAFGMDPTIDNSQSDPDGDGLPNIAEFMLGTNPLMADNPLNLPTITNGTVLNGYAQLPLVGISPSVATPAVTLLENGSPATGAVLLQGPDGLWSIYWDTSHLSNGPCSIQVEMQCAHEGDGEIVSGVEKSVTISNLVTFDSLTSQFTDYGLIIYGTLNGMTNAGIAVQLSDDYGNPLVYGNFTVTNGVIDLYWDLTDGHGDQISFGNVQAMFTITDEDVDPPPTNITQWFYHEGGAGGGNFVSAWGWDVNFYQFNNNQNNMIENGVIDILANPAANNPYTMGPCCIWNLPQSSAATFRYDSDSDKQILTNALAQDLYFFWLGHGNWNTILGNADHSNLSATEVQTALQNLLPQATPKHPKSNAHPYKLVVLNGCQTDADLWPRSFGIDYDPPGTTNYVVGYRGTGRTARAFVGWQGVNEAPGAGDFTGLAHAEFTEALGSLWGDWMHGFPLNLCLEDFANVATNNSFTGQDSWHISGCVDLQRGD